MTLRGLAPRPAAVIDFIAKTAYGPTFDSRRLCAGLDVIAAALNDGHIGRAQIAVLQLRLPNEGWNATRGSFSANGGVAKYSPNQPRDWRGRWTDGDREGDGSTAVATPGATATGPATTQRLGTVAANPLDLPLSSRSRPPLPGARAIQFHGRWTTPRLFQGGTPPEDEPPPIGHNGPPGEPLEIEREPETDAGAAPPRWDVPGQTIGGLYYPPRRFPVFADGTPWPVVTAEAVRQILARRPGKQPSMVVFVPADGKGPMLIGSTRDKEYPAPKGYFVVELRGTPQANFAGGRETDHADRSVAEAMRLAATNQFSTIFFNSTVSTGTGRLVESLLRPDVYAVYRPKLNFTPPGRWHASEIKSPGQENEYRTPEELQMMGVKDVTYKILLSQTFKRGR